MRFCLTSPLFLELDLWVKSQGDELAAPAQAQYHIRAMETHQRFVQHFERSASTPHYASSQHPHRSPGVAAHPSPPAATSPCVSLLLWLCCAGDLESFIVEQGSSVPKFMKLCQALERHKEGSDAVQLLLELLSQLTSFTTFVELARDEGKRKYIKQILVGYAAMVPQ